MASGHWSIGQHEPYWRTNTSFSPQSSRWDFSFPSEELQYGSPDSSLSHRSSTTSINKESGWMRGNHLYNYQCSSSDGAGMFFSSPDLSPGPQWTPPEIQEISVDDYEIATRQGQVLRLSHSKSVVGGTSRNSESRKSTSSCSDSSESEPMFKTFLSSHRNFAGHRSFLSKPIHPLFFPKETSTDASENLCSGSSESSAGSLHGDAHHFSCANSNFDFSDSIESENLGQLCISSDGFRCILCKRFLSQRSPWGSRRIVKSGDMPVAGVLPCCHVFHAECLEQTTPKSQKSDPPCPLCIKLDGGNSTDLQAFTWPGNGFPSLRTSSEYGPSRPWGYVATGDCLEGLSHPPKQNTMLLLNRHRMRKNLSLKGNSSKEFPGKMRKTGTYTSKSLSGRSVDLGTAGCSKTNC